MEKSLRSSEAWYRRGLWAVAVVFAAFLVGLGGAVMRDLPQVEPGRTLSFYTDATQAKALRDAQSRASQEAANAQAALDQARLKLRIAHADTQAAHEGLERWLATRQVTQQSAQDPEVLSRTRSLDGLRTAEREAQAVVQAQEKALLDARQSGEAAQRQLAEQDRRAREAWEAESRRVELRVFLWRLAFTLPLLLLAGWVFHRFRRSSGWPFAWGYILFAVFTFFVELVPYLPSYGGYVRYGVGAVLTVVVGRQVIRALNDWLERQRAAEALPDARRRQAMAYDTALARLAKGLCPGCERPVDMRDEKLDFCPHCGITLHDHCSHCQHRKNAFARYCIVCGAPAQGAVASAGGSGAAPDPAPA